MAVIGIVAFQPVIYRQFYFRNWLPDKIWMIFSASLAAQLTTFPIVIFYFKQLPLLFFLSNLIAIPLAVFILYTGLLMFVLSFWPLTSAMLGDLLNNVITICNHFFMLLEKLPFTSWKGLHIIPAEIALLYL